MSTVHACTIIARNYLPFARVLAASFAEHHPGGHLSVLVIDDLRQTAHVADAVESLYPESFLDRHELHEMAMIYEVTELATALKPFLLRHLLDRGSPHLIYLDPDVRLYGSLEEIAALAEQREIVLTPHTTVPMPRDGRKPTEIDILASGVYNLGFVGLAAGSAAFLEFWCERVRRECLIDHQGMLFTDQRWIDFVPGYFPHHILRDPTCNVAYWNLGDRDLQWANDRYEVDGRPLTFFHFSGFDPAVPHLLSRHQGSVPRVLLSERRAVARICHEYADAIIEAGWRTADGAESAPYGYGHLPDGTVLDRRMRRVFREVLLEADQGRGQRPPDPFVPGGEADVLALFNLRVRFGRPGISRYLEALWQDRADLQAAFPDVRRRDSDRYVEWVVSTGQFEEDIPPALVPQAPSALDETEPAPTLASPSVLVVGYFRAELGVGEGARLLLPVLDAAGISYTTRTWDVTSNRQAHAFADQGSFDHLHDINIVCVNADMTTSLHADLGHQLIRDRYTIGVWAWETADFPASMMPAFDFVDEIWAVSHFTADVLRRMTSKPVYALPHAIVVPEAAGTLTRDDLGLPDRFMFLNLFDFNSVMERKNPLGLIEAFRRAFEPDEGPVLVIKTINGDLNLVARERLLAAAAQHPDVIVFDRYLGATERIELIGLCDAYVSLHRGEGFGLTMAEAMALGKPVIATAYSGNLDFMTAENSFLVDYDLTGIPPGCDPYPPGGRWADPNIGMAAGVMRLVVDHPDVASEKAGRGRSDVERSHSVQARVPLVRERLAAIRAGRAEPGQAAPESASGASSDRAILAAELVARPAGGEGPSRYGIAGLIGRRAVIRLTRPYWWGHQLVDQALLDLTLEERGVRETELAQLRHGIAQVEHELRLVREALTASIRQRLTETENQILLLRSKLETLAGELAATVEATEARWRHLEERLTPERPEPTHLVGGGLDQPLEGATTRHGVVPVSGWAITAPQPLVRVEIRVDDRVVDTARIGLPRPDVGLLYDTPEAAVAGFEQWIDLTELGDIQSITVEATAVAADGAGFVIGAREVAVEPPASVQAAPPVLGLAPLRVLTSANPATPRTSARHVLALTHDLDRGGAQLGLLDIVSRLHQRGIAITVLAPGSGPMKSEFERHGLAVEVQPPPPLDQPDEYERAVTSLIAWADAQAFDAVIVNTLVPFWGIEIAVRLDLPSLWSIHEHYPPPVFWATWLGAEDAMHPAIAARAVAALGDATEVVLASGASRTLLERYRSSGRFEVIANAVDVDALERQAATRRRESTRRHGGFSADGRIAACIGPIEPHKGQVVLAGAVSLLGERHSDVRWVLVGGRGGAYATGLQRYVADADLAPRVTITPFTNDVVEWLALADLLVCPSDNEVLPTVVLEAMAAGVPVVASDVGGVADVVHDGVTGYLCPPSDIMGLAVALDRALSAAPTERHAMIAQARQRVTQHHDSHRRAELYDAILRRLIGHGRSRSVR